MSAAGHPVPVVRLVAAGMLLGVLLGLPAGTAAGQGNTRPATPATPVSADQLSKRIVALLASQVARPGFSGITAAHWQALSATPLAPSPDRPGVVRAYAQVREGWGYWIESRTRSPGRHVVELYVLGKPAGTRLAHCTFPFDAFAARMVAHGFDYDGPQPPPGSSRVNFFSRPHFPVVVITYLPSGAGNSGACVESIQVEPSEQGNG